MLRWRADDTELLATSNKTRRRHKRTSRVQKGEDNYVEVDVTTKTPVRFYLDNNVSHQLLYKGSGSRLELTTKPGEDMKVLVIRWCRGNFAALDKDDVAIDIVSQYVTAPVYEAKQSFMHEGMHVSVGVRAYIEGRPLSDTIHLISETKLQMYMSQVESAMNEMGRVASQRFGSILDGKLSCNNALQHIRMRIMLEKVSGNRYITDAVTESAINVEHSGVPVFCHGQLWPEHIIVDDFGVKGIVGWSNADFIMERVDRILYKMCDEKSYSNKKWRDFLSAVPIVHDTDELSPGVKTCIISYCEAVSMDRTGGRSSSHIKNISSILLPDVSMIPAPLSSSRRESDKTSLSALTNNTEQTWENFTNTTVTE